MNLFHKLQHQIIARFQQYPWFNTRRQLLHLAYFAFLFTAVAGLFLSLERHPIERDLTQNRVNSLSATSKALIKQIKAPLEITLYSVNDETITDAKTLARRYQMGGLEVNLQVFTQALPESLQRRFNIKTEAADIHLNGHDEWVLLNQRHLTEALVTETIYRLHTQQERFAVFLETIGKSATNSENEILKNIQQNLSYMGMHTTALLSGANTNIPQNTSLLVFTSSMLESEQAPISQIRAFIERGGNALFVLQHPPHETLMGLLETLDIQIPTQNPLIPYVQFSESNPRKFTSTPVIFANAEHTRTSFEEGSSTPAPDEALVGLELKRAIPFGAFPHEQRILIAGGLQLTTLPNLQSLWKQAFAWLTTDDTIKVTYQEATDFNFSSSTLYQFYVNVVLCFMFPILFAALGGLTLLRQRRHIKQTDA